MTATEVLRAMLDERGVEWETNDRYTARWLTRWKSNGIEWRAEEEGMALLLKTVDGIEPEQAIEATLGREECRIEAHFGEWYCTGCGVMVGTCDPYSELYVDGNYISMWNYCPNCGRAVRA